MSGPKWGIAGAALLLIGAAWLFRSAGHEPRVPRPVVPEASPPEQESEHAASLEEVGAAEGARAEFAPVPAEDGSGATLEIRVLAGPSRAPVARAEVFVLDRTMPRPPNARDPILVDSEIEGLGRRSVTDQEGRVRVAPPTGPGVVIARSGAGFATLEIDAGEPGPVVLVLEPDPPVRVLVVERGGKPVAGVPVALGELVWQSEPVRAITSEDGTAELHPREHRKTLTEGRAYVGLSLPLMAGESVRVPVDLERPPPQPIVLVLPETGSLAVTLLDEHAEPFRKPARIWIEAAPREPAAAKVQVRPSAIADAHDGRLSFERVGLGLELHIRAQPLEREESSLTVPGPETPGQRVEVRLEVGRAVPVLLGRILDPDRRPIAAARLELDARFGGPGMGVTTATDAAGRFRCGFDATDFEPQEATELVLVARQPRGEAYHGRILRPRFGDGETDLGDVALARSPLVARGTVVDEEEQPVRRASVTFLRDATPGPGYSGTRLEEVQTDALGRFEWRAQVEGDSIGVRVAADGFAGPDTQVVPAGTDGLRFVLVRGGWLAGRVLFTLSLWPSFELWREGELVNTPFSTGGFGQPGRFRLGPLSAGTYSLACSYPWSTERSWIDGLVVVAGSESTDPRLDPLDLRTFLPTVALTIVDREGASVPDPVILLPGASSGGLESAHPGRDGERWLVQGSPLPLRIRVEAPGFRTQELAAVDSDRRVVLERGIPVRLEFVGDLPALPAGWELRGQLMRQAFGASADGPARRTRLRETSFALTDGKAELWLAEPSGYLFTFLVSQDSRMRNSSFWDEPQPVVEIRDDGTLQAFELRAPSEETVREMLAYVAKEDARPVFR